MFKFNFSANTESTSSNVDKEDSEEPHSDVCWTEAAQLNLSVKPIEGLQSLTWRELKFDDIVVKLLRREIALTNIEQDAQSPRFAIEAELNNSDLQSAKYEGGLKVWECSEDLSNYITRNMTGEILHNKDILDLGCGSGLVGILALLFGARSVTFQDYNEEVLTHWTCPNVSLNFTSTDKDISARCNFWSGDWGSFSTLCPDKYDYIFTSETIYNPDNYGKLKNIFCNQMKPTSSVLLAAKSVYFSLGGSVQLFLSYINKDSKKFNFNDVFKSDEGVQRVIVEIKPENSLTT